MNLLEFFQIGSTVLEFFMQSSILPGGAGDCDDWILFGSAFNAITAAWATLGYYAQADVLYYMHAGWEKFAILLYTGAGIAGLASMAFGQPPKTWVWFFIGPAVYYFAIDTRQPVHGVAWMVGSYVQNQDEVWKQAEAGAVNSGVVRRGMLSFSAEGPTDSVPVSVPFLMLDSLISDTVRQLSVWSGALSQVNPARAGLNTADSTKTNVAYENMSLDGYRFGETLTSTEQCQVGKVHFSAVSNTKWTYLNSVTQAELTNTDARDAFARFMTSECGGHLSSVIDYTNYAKAVNFKDRDLPDSVILKAAAGSTESRYWQLREALGNQIVPTPPTLRKLLRESLQTNSTDTGSSFIRAVDWSLPGEGTSQNQCGVGQGEQDTQWVNYVLSQDVITCDGYLYMLLLYFRYEAALIFSQTFQSSGPHGWWPDDMIYNMLYGWDIPFNDANACSNSARGMDTHVQYQFVYNLILAHLFRNEMNRLPELVTVGKDKTQAIVDDSQLYNASIGSTSKAAEVYTWSLMIPYVQGILLYLLTMAFPVVCMLMLVPSWMKIIVTWTSFFVWVKLWDLGFAFVASLERTLWAQMANSNASREVNGKILAMSEYGGFFDRSCRVPVLGLLRPTEATQLGFIPYGSCTPTLYLTEGPGWCNGANYGGCLNIFDSNVTPHVSSSAAPGFGVAESAFDASLAIFDLGLIVGSSLDFDLANGYYIYIMSALYFAVPAVTGQMVLGAKSGVAGMVDKIAGDPAGKAASAAGQSYTGNETARMKQNAATVSQESLAKGHRENGLVDQALNQQNLAAEEGRLAAHYGQVAEGSNRIAQAVSSGNEYRRAAQQPGHIMMKGVLGLNYDWTGKRIGEGAQHVPGNGGSAPVGAAGEPPKPRGTPTNPIFTEDSDDAKKAKKAKEAQEAQDSKRNRWGANLLSAANAYLDSMQAAYHSDLTRENTSSSNQASAYGGAAGIQAYAAGQRSSGYRSASERTMAQAQFAAQTAQYDAMNNYSNQRAGRMAVLGVPPGMIGPERRPEDAMGMAMAGMLDAPGRATRQKANFFDPSNGNGFFSGVQGGQQALHSNYGYAAVRGEYLGRAQKAGFTDGDFGKHVVPGSTNLFGKHWDDKTIEKYSQAASQFVEARAPKLPPEDPNK